MGHSEPKFVGFLAEDAELQQSLHNIFYLVFIFVLKDLLCNQLESLVGVCTHTKKNTFLFSLHFHQGNFVQQQGRSLELRNREQVLFP